MGTHFLLSRRTLFFYAKVIATLIILYILVHYSQLKIELFSTIFYQPFLSVTVIALFCLTVLTNTWRWYRLNSVQAIKLPFNQSIAPTYVGIAFNNILPGSIGGDIVRCYYILKKFPERKSSAFLSTIVDRVCGLLGIIVISCVAASCRLEVVSHNNYLYSLLLICLSSCVVGLLIFCLSMLLPERVGLSQWLEKKFKDNYLFRPVVSLLRAVNVYRKSKWVIIECLCVSIISQLLLLIAILLINTMMGLPTVSFFDYMLALSIAQIANLIPLTPGGVGIGEAAFANILLMLNPGTIGAYATVFFAFRLLMAVSYLPGVIIGIFGFHFTQRKTLLSEGISYEQN